MQEMNGKTVVITGASKGIGAQAARVFADVGTNIVLLERGRADIDVLINNADTNRPVSRLAKSDPYGWAGATNVNLTGMYHGVSAVLPIMLAAGSGSILTVPSGAAHGHHYCAPKAGAAMITRTIDLAERVQCIPAFGLIG